MELDNNPTHEEIWDDSALVNSWNQALKEYEKYHSIHTQGGTIEDILDTEKVPAAGGAAKAETEQPLRGSPRRQRSDETQTENRNETSQEAKRTQVTEQIGSQRQVAHGGTAPVIAPQMLLGSVLQVQDEDLKKLLMSWYYAGYYTGLYEGKQQAEQAGKPPQ